MNDRPWDGADVKDGQHITFEDYPMYGYDTKDSTYRKENRRISVRKRWEIKEESEEIATVWTF
jgi:hypothetical protein